MRFSEFLSFGADTYLKYLCGLQYNAPGLRSKLTKIICTIGPTTRTPEILEDLMCKGMNIARLNFSHGSHEYHAESISIVREAAKNYSQQLTFNSPIAIALDTKGPEIRIGLIDGSATGEVELKSGDLITLTPNDDYLNKCTKDILYVDYKNISKLLIPGNHVYLDDGLISLRVQKIEGEMIQCKIEYGGKLGSKKGVNLPGVNVDLPAISEKDEQDLKFGVEQGVDMIFASFIRNAEAVDKIRNVLGNNGKHIKIISKIENQQGMQNIDEIIDASDGVMVARGDLGIEIPPEMVFVAQKTIIARCNREGKPVICATQMLDSMVRSPQPTRAEATDVANAVIDGADAVMLSAETAKGKYPSACVNIMSNICRQAESIIWYREHFKELYYSADLCAIDVDHAMAIAVVQASLKCYARAILIVTTNGNSAFLVSRYRPRCPILMVTECGSIARQSHLHRGIMPIVYECPKKDNNNEDLQSRIEYGFNCAIEIDVIQGGDYVVVLVPPPSESGFKDQMYIETVY